MASVLDLDATVVGSYIDDAIDLVAGALGRRPRTVVDIGAVSYTHLTLPTKRIV